MSLSRITAGAIAVALCVGSAGVGVSKQSYAQVKAPAAASGSFSEADVKSFVVALLEVEKVGLAWQDRVEEASAEKKPQLEAQAHQEMVQAVEDSGMSVDNYNKIARAAATDPELRDEIVKHVNEMRQ